MEFGIITEGQLNLIKEIRKFWEQQVMWMRFIFKAPYGMIRYARSAQQTVYKFPGFLLFVDRFGRSAAERFASFITAHMSRIVSLIGALKSNDQETVNRLTVELNENASDWAAFLGQMNPYWEETQWRQLLQSFVGQTINEVVAIMSGDYEEGIRIFDNIENVAYEIADYLAKGIIFSFVP